MQGEEYVKYMNGASGTLEELLDKSKLVFLGLDGGDIIYNITIDKIF
jgi:hypothetical protein